MFRKTKVASSIVLAFGGFAMLGAPGAWAQDSSQLERVTVTGSNIKRTDAETASPVQVITREDIVKTGKQSLAEVLRGITSDGQGSIPSSFSNGFASGSSAISLRGLGVNSTLVLLNGRRMTTYGLADDGTRNFVDLNSLPLEAVERVEVVKDGASAIYGADAVGGVVNVILRKSYNGASVGGSYGQTSKSDGKTKRAFGAFGFGDLDADNYNVFATIEASKQNNIIAGNRGFLGQSDLRQFGYYDLTNGASRPYFNLGPSSTSPYGVTRAADGTGPRVNILPCPGLQDPATGLCRYNGLATSEIQPELEKLNIFSRGTLKINENLTAYLELGYFDSKSKSTAGYSANNDTGVFNPGDLSNPLFTHGFQTLPASHPDNTFGVDRSLFLRPTDIGPRGQNTDSQVFRLVQGFEGNALGWDFDAGLSYIHSKLKNENIGYINYNAMQAALNNGTYRITSPSLTDPSVIAAISPTLVNEPTSTVKSIDFKASRSDLATLPGGGLGVAVGAEMRWESADTPPVPGTETASIVGLGYSAFKANRRVEAVYGEVTAPVMKWLELSGALRYDHYSDFGNSTTPKVGFKLKPIDQFALRGTYSEAFRAPGPAERGGSSFGFTTYGILSQGDPTIKPEKAKSYTLGIVAEPIAGTSATLDYWSVRRKNEIIAADPNSIIGNNPTTAAPNSRAAGALPNTFLYYDNDGNLATVTGFYQNASRTNTDGIDLEVRNQLKLGTIGRLSTQLNWSHTLAYKRTGTDGVELDYAGTHGPLSQSAGGGTPKDKITLAVTLDQDNWGVTGSLNYVGAIKMIDHKGETTDIHLDPDTGVPDGLINNTNTGVYYPDAGQYNCGVFDTSGNVYNNCRLPSFTTFDLFARWSPIKNLDVNVSVQNLFDRKAPFDPYLAIPYGINYNQTWHQAGAVGRFITVGAKYAF